MPKVIIAEKPSVARNIAEAVGSTVRKDGYFEGKEYIVTWAFGHLLELYDAKEYDEKMKFWRMENYPFIPDNFRYRIKYADRKNGAEDEGAKKQIRTIESLLRRADVSSVISACDYDREGQIIGDILLDYIEKESSLSKEQERLLLNEWTPGEVRKGLSSLIPNREMSNLKDAGISRQWADWVIGINLTSVATLKYQRGWTGMPLNIGRVLLPTLKIIYDRDMEIERFQPEEYSKFIASFRPSATDESVENRDRDYEGIYTLGDQERFADKELLRRLAKNLKGKSGIVIDKKSERKREYPPPLFNLSGLQGYITAKYKGWTSEKVLQTAQDLYEKKLITYPRTASTALAESLKEKAAKVLEVVKKGRPYEEEIRFSDSKRIFNDAKVESHSAIIPTYILPKNLKNEEAQVYRAICDRFVMQFMPAAEHDEGVLVTRVQAEGEEADFVSKGRIQQVRGWKKVEDISSKDKILPAVEIGDETLLFSFKIETKSTKPPQHHTEKTLLRAMETCGKKYKEDQKREDSEQEEEQSDEMMQAILSGFSIGTPATRAETIKKLKTVGYIAVKGKHLYATEMGRRLVEVFPVKELLDLEYTGRLEKTLSDIEKGKCSKQEFLDRIFQFTGEAVKRIKKDEFHIICQGTEDPSKDHRSEFLGKCPGCGGNVIEKEKFYACDNHKGGCKFILWKEDRFLTSLKVRITKEVVKSLLQKRAVYGNRFVNKQGQHFEAVLTYEKNSDNDYYNWKLHPVKKRCNQSQGKELHDE